MAKAFTNEAVLFTLACICSLTFASALNVSRDWLIGIYGPITSLSQAFLAGMVAFDLDFRKHFEPDLIERLGPPLVEIPDVHPLLQQVGVVGGNSHSNPEVGGQTVKDWVFTCGASSPQVLAIVGGYHSAVSTRIAPLLATFKTPQVAYGSTSPLLSDKSQYPFFLRTIPEDTIQAQAMWAWMQHFGIHSASVVFAQEPYGEGLFQAVADTAGALSHRIKEVGIPYMPDLDKYDAELVREALQGVKESGSRFIFMGLIGTDATSALHLLEQDGLLGGAGGYQVLGGESVFPLDPGPLTPSRASLIGLQKLYYAATGPLWPRFEELWGNLTHADLYGEEARERYMLDSWEVGLESARTAKLTEDDLKGLSDDEPGDQVFPAFLFDAAYTIVIAMNELLHRGVGLANMSSDGTVLLEEMRATVFDGLTGRVSFDAQGNREGQFHIWNLQQSSNSTGGEVKWAIVSLYDLPSNSLQALADTVWSTGDSSPTVPASLLSCPAGFQRESATNLCERCRPGIGCGFQVEDGFPLGIYGPFTSVDYEPLALAVIFDLDFRKNREPSLQERFGPPIVHVPNLHPDLKIKTQIGTSHSQVDVAVETALDWFTGAGDFSKIAGLVGGYFSSIAGPVASTAAVFKVPQVGWGASSPTLSDKTLYPWFSRVNPPDSLQGEALWVYMVHYSIPSVSLVYSRESYGEGVFQATTGHATVAGQAGRISGVAIRFQTINAYDVNEDIAALTTVKRAGKKFIILAVASSNHVTSLFYVFDTLGMLYGSEAFQFLGTESVTLVAANQYQPSRGFPVGMQRVQQVTQGRLYPKFLDMWHNMTVDDVFGPEASNRYMLNYFKVLISEGSAPQLTEASFKQEPFFFYMFMVDSAYTYVFALNNLLNRGIRPEEIHGEMLLDEVRNTTFEGVTGMVSFNSLGDRHTDSELWNVQLDSEGKLRNGTVALWKAGSSSYEFFPNQNLTWATGINSPVAPDELTACPAGLYWDGSTRLCLPCERNTYTTGADGKAEWCTSCGAGWVSLNASGSTGCKRCERGSFRINEPDCVACPAGTFGASEGQSACEDCGVGNYSSQEGMQACEICGAGFATQNLFKTMAWVEVGGVVEYYYLSGAQQEEDCGCDRDTRRDLNNECIQCGEGMICQGMNDVTIAEGYYAGPIVRGGLSVFKCHGDSLRCKGGLPGQTCAEGRVGLTCAECKDSFTPADNGKCEDCGGGDVGPFLIVVLLAALMLAGLYRIVDTQNRAKGSHALVLAGTSVGMFMTTVQLLAVLGTLPVEYEDPLQSFMDSFSFNLDLIRINCVSTSSPLSRYCIKVLMIVVVVCFLTIMHVLAVLFYHGRASGWRWHSLTAGIGALFMVFYITVTSTVLEPLQCQHHPNDKWTVLSYPSILCWEGGDHQTMLILGIFAFVFVPLAYMVACMLAVKQFPSRMSAGDVGFLKAFSFLFIRYRASRHTFVLKQMMRSFSVAMVLVIPNTVVQVFVLQVVLLAGYTASLALQPWRVEEANVLDCLQGAFSVLVVCLTSLFLEQDRSDLQAVAWIALFFIIATVAFTFFGGGYGLTKKYLCRRKPFQYFLCHHKAGAGAYTRLLKMQLKEHPKVVADVFLDSDNLDNLDCLFDYVGNSTSMLVVVCSAEIFSRPWCLGEMCTARLHGVPVVRLGMPSFNRPDEQFITRLVTCLDGLDALAENGIDIDMVQTTLVWMNDTPIFNVPHFATSDVMVLIVARLVSKEWTDVEIGTGTAGTASTQDKSIRVPELERVLCPLFYDKANLEAEATASILKKRLVPLMAHRSRMVPELWTMRKSPDGAIAIVVLCSNGIFTNDDLLCLFNMQFTGSLLPILAETAFRFPGKDLAEELRGQRPSMKLEDSLVIAAFVHSLFKEIAISFVAQHAGEAELKLAAGHCSARLLAAGLKPGTSTKSVYHSTSSTSSSFIRAVSSGTPNVPRGPSQTESNDAALPSIADSKQNIDARDDPDLNDGALGDACDPNEGSTPGITFVDYDDDDAELIVI